MKTETKVAGIQCSHTTLRKRPQEKVIFADLKYTAAAWPPIICTATIQQTARHMRTPFLHGLRGDKITCNELLFVDKEVPTELKINVDGKEETLPVGGMDPGHDSWWDRCFVNNPSKLPKFHYEFCFPRYCLKGKHLSEGLRKLKEAQFRQAQLNGLFIIELIKRYDIEPLFINLFIEHVLTDEDIENAKEINLASLFFEDDNRPDELSFEVDQFYRFVYR